MHEPVHLVVLGSPHDEEEDEQPEAWSNVT